MTTSLARRSVPFFNYAKAFSADEEAYVRIFRDVLRRGAFIMQHDLARFEQNLATYLGVKHAIGVGNCTDALIISLRAAGVGPGDEVIFPSHTMVASPSAVHLVGATPVPVDCGDDHLIDAAAIESALTPRTKAIMPVQLNGRTADMSAICAIAARHGLVVVEDSAQALGSKFDGRFAGTFGVTGSFSFYPAKTLGCFGDGGAIVTNDDDVAHRAKLLRDHGRDAETGDVVQWGMNSRLDNLQAAFLDHQLARYDEVIARRREIAGMYDERLTSLAQVVLPPGPDDGGDHFDVYQNYEIEATDRDGLRDYLRENGVGTLVQWGGKAVHQWPKLGFTQHLPRTERLFERCLMLPMNMTLTNDDVDYCCDLVRAYYAQ